MPPISLKCPECAAPLNASANLQRCPYCGATIQFDGLPAAVIAAETLDERGALRPAPQLTPIVMHLMAGRHGEAVRAYRALYGVDLNTANNALQTVIARYSIPTPGQPAQPQWTRPTPSRPASQQFGAAMLIALSVAFALWVGLQMFGRALQPARTPLVSVPTPFPMAPRPVFPVAPPPPPEPLPFADLALHFGAEGIGPGQFKDARSVAVDGSGNIYVGEYLNGRVQVFDAAGKFRNVWSVGHDHALLNLAALRDGTVLALIDGRILRVDGVTGKAEGEAPTPANDGSTYYVDACVAADGSVDALDFNAALIVINRDGVYQRTIKLGEKTGEPVHFQRIAVNGLGEIYCLDQKAGVFRFSADGRYLNRFGAADTDDRAARDLPQTLWAPRNMVIDGQGRIYVADGNPAIKVFSASGTYLGGFGGGDLSFGLAIDDAGAIYSSFRNLNEVRKYSPHASH